jgi:hypothetical protein
MGESRHQLLDQALALSEQMVELGDGSDWEAVIALEPQRRALLEQAFATHAPVDDVITQRVQAILDLDRQLMAITLEARDRAATEIGQASKGRKATSAYRNAGR